MLLTDAIIERFPQLAKWQFQSIKDGEETTIPAWLGLLLSQADSDSGPICFVLPRAGDVARVFSILQGLIRFSLRFEELAAALTAQTLRVGERVRVNPSGHVFIYGGQDAADSRFHWLNYLNGGGRRTIPNSELLRLERVERTMPRGTAGSNLDAISSAPLDQLLGTKTWGNRSLFKNEVLLLDSRSGFIDFAINSRVIPSGVGVNSFPLLTNLISVGRLSADGLEGGEWFDNPSAEPLIAVTRSPQTLAAACHSFPERSRLVVSNGLAFFRKHDQEFDEIASSQRMVLLASYGEEETLVGLAQRGCRVWRISSAELALSPAPASGLFHRVSRWSEYRQQFTLNPLPCNDTMLGDVCIKLQSLEPQIAEQPDGPLARIMGEAWGLLTSLASLLAPPISDELRRFEARLASFKAYILTQRVWLGGSAPLLLELHRAFEDCLTSEARTGTTKSDRLFLELLEAVKKGKKLHLLARNDNHASQLQSWVDRKCNNLPGHPRKPAIIYTPRTLPDEGDLPELVCIAWHRAEFFQRVAAQLVTPRLSVLTYPFEQIWLAQCHRRLRQPPRLPTLTPALKLDSFGSMPPSFEWPDDLITSADVVTAIPTTFDVFQFESRSRNLRKDAESAMNKHDSVPCRYVSFVGDKYAYLSLTHRVPVATELLSSIGSAVSQKLPERLLSEIHSSDFVVFPLSGDHDLLAEIANRRLGYNATNVRALAGLWRNALLHPARTKASAMALITGQPQPVPSGTPDEPWELDSARFQRLAELLGHRVTAAVARDWFNSDERLGPGRGPDGLRRSLEVIAKVTAHSELERSLDDVFRAVCDLRSAHQSAGVELRKALLKSLPSELGRIEEGGSLIDLGELGSAWVVQVDFIAELQEYRGATEVNRLLRSPSAYE